MPLELLEPKVRRVLLGNQVPQGNRESQAYRGQQALQAQQAQSAQQAPQPLASLNHSILAQSIQRRHSISEAREGLQLLSN